MLLINGENELCYKLRNQAFELDNSTTLIHYLVQDETRLELSRTCQHKFSTPFTYIKANDIKFNNIKLPLKSCSQS